MESDKSIRWKQRFADYQKALKHLENSLSIQNPDVVQQAGVIQLFEVAFELSWKTLKDYLIAIGYNVTSPRSVLQQAFKDKIIVHGHEWIDALEKRNLLAHIYDEEQSQEAITLIRNEYFQLLKDLENYLLQTV
jgi:nucleotidyltransferase substrate binding protein (TIGR01987 family)